MTKSQVPFSKGEIPRATHRVAATARATCSYGLNAFRRLPHPGDRKGRSYALTAIA